MLIAIVVAALTLAVCSWIAPLIVAAEGVHKIVNTRMSIISLHSRNSVEHH
jgi:hypothetical protein